MVCVICRNGNTVDEFVTFTLERDNMIIIFKNVPVLVCENCGDFYLSSETTTMLLERASEVVDKGIEIEVINLNSAA